MYALSGGILTEENLFREFLQERKLAFRYYSVSNSFAKDSIRFQNFEHACLKENQNRLNEWKTRKSSLTVFAVPPFC